MIMVYLTDMQFAIAIALICTANYLVTIAVVLHEKHARQPYGAKIRRLP